MWAPFLDALFGWLFAAILEFFTITPLPVPWF